MLTTECVYLQGLSLYRQRIDLVWFLPVQVVALAMAELPRSSKSISECVISLTGTQWKHQEKMQKTQIYSGVLPVPVS